MKIEKVEYNQASGVCVCGQKWTGTYIRGTDPEFYCNRCGRRLG